VSIALALVVVIALGAALGFGPVVRARLRAEAEKRGLKVEVGSVRPGWMAVRLLDVHVHPKDKAHIDAHFDEVRVDVDAGAHVRTLTVNGGEVALEGSPHDILESLRGRAAESSGASATQAPLPVTVRGLHVTWRDGDDAVEATGAGATLADRKRDVSAATLRVSVRGARVDATGAYVALDGTTLRGAHVATASLTLPRAAQTKAEANAKPDAKAEDAPFFPHPDLPRLLALSRILSASIASRLPEASAIEVEALSFSAGDLALGPGALSLSRHDAHVELTFRVAPASPRGREPASRIAEAAQADSGIYAAPGTPPLSLHLVLPLDDADDSRTPVASLDGGPLSLRTLGLRDGFLGLTDLDRAMLAGRARLELDTSGQVLQFDADVHLRSLTVRHRRIARDKVDGIDLDVLARGTLSASGLVWVDESTLGLGPTARISVHGWLDDRPNGVAADVTLDVPRVGCQALLTGLPRALVPTLQDTELDGDFDAHLYVSFDPSHLDHLVFEDAIHDGCAWRNVPAQLARERFRRPFTHRAYASDSTVYERTTGPGDPSWTPLHAMSRYLPIAVLLTEDGGEFRRSGFHYGQIKLAIETDLAHKRFERGGSTLTQQVAKNLFLSRDKTVARKLEEAILTRYLAATFSKEQILELYLNLAEFAPDTYGVRAGAWHYFQKAPNDVTFAEALMLAAMMPSPLRFHGVLEKRAMPSPWLDTLRKLMRLAEVEHLVTPAELATGEADLSTFEKHDDYFEPRGGASGR
jgi:hypothetical protein